MAQGFELTVALGEEYGTVVKSSANYKEKWGSIQQTNLRGVLMEAPDGLDISYEQMDIEEFSRGHRDVEQFRHLTRSVTGDLSLASIRVSDPVFPLLVKHLFGQYDKYGTQLRGAGAYGLCQVGSDWGQGYLHSFVPSPYRYEGTRQGELGNYWFGTLNSGGAGRTALTGTAGRVEGLTAVRMIQTGPGAGVKTYPMVGLRPQSANPLIGVAAGEPVTSTFSFVGKQQLGTIEDLSAQITLPGQNDQIFFWSDVEVCIDNGTREIDSLSVTVDDPLEVQPTIRAGNDRTIGQAIPAGFRNINFEFSAQYDDWVDTLRAKSQGGDGTAVDVKINIARGTNQIYVHLPRWKPAPFTPNVNGPGRHVQSVNGRCHRTTVSNIGTYAIRLDWVGTVKFLWNAHTYGTTQFLA